MEGEVRDETAVCLCASGIETQGKKKKPRESSTSAFSPVHVLFRR